MKDRTRYTVIALILGAVMGIGYLVVRSDTGYCFRYVNNQCVYMTSAEYREWSDKAAMEKIHGDQTR